MKHPSSPLTDIAIGDRRGYSLGGGQRIAEARTA
jgi:hypothetical protein